MMGIFKDYTIPFEGLKIGKHNFEFKPDRTFFEAFENSIIPEGKFDVELQLTKEETMLLLNFNIRGIVQTACDRCGDDLEVPLEFNNQTIIKFGEGISETEEIILLPVGAYECNVAQLIYELICVHFPQKNIHANGKCNKKIIDKLNKLQPSHSSEVDPRWKELEKIKETH